MSRQTYVVGRRTIKGQELACKCAWCGRWWSPEDEELASEGRDVSHGCCPPCQREHFGLEVPDEEA